MAKGKTYELMLKIAGKADSSLKAACSAAEKNLASLSNTAKKVAKTVTAVAAAAVIGATSVASSSLATYSDFQSAMDATAVTARASEAEYAAMSAAARQMGATTTKTATEAAEAMGYMSLAGWNVQQSLTGLEPMLRLSEATSMDLARASDLVTDSMSALGIGVEGMEDYLNLSVQAQRASNTTAEMLMEAFIGCGGAAKTAGVDMGDLSTALGVLANSGTKGAEAGTALNSIIMRMTSKDVAIKAMKGLGVSVYNAAGEFRGLETILTDVSAAMSGMSADDKMAALAKIAGTNYSTEMSYLLDAVAQGADGAASAWSALETDIMDHSGVLLEVAKANTDNLKGAAAIFQSAVAELQLQIGEQLAPYEQEALTYLAENVLRKAGGNHPAAGGGSQVGAGAPGPDPRHRRRSRHGCGGLQDLPNRPDGLQCGHGHLQDRDGGQRHGDLYPGRSHDRPEYPGAGRLRRHRPAGGGGRPALSKLGCREGQGRGAGGGGFRHMGRHRRGGSERHLRHLRAFSASGRGPAGLVEERGRRLGKYPGGLLQHHQLH